MANPLSSKPCLRASEYPLALALAFSAILVPWVLTSGVFFASLTRSTSAIKALGSSGKIWLAGSPSASQASSARRQRFVGAARLQSGADLRDSAASRSGAQISASARRSLLKVDLRFFWRHWQDSPDR